MGFCDIDMRRYDEIESAPKVPKTPSYKPTAVSWIILAIVTALFAGPTHAIINAVWIPWIILFPARNVYIYQRKLSKFNQDLDAWSVRAKAHTERVIRQLHNYSKRDWN